MWTHERLRPKRWRSGVLCNWKQWKYNGHRFTVYKQPDGKLVGFEREIRADREMTLLRPKIVEYDWWQKLQHIPPMSSIDGELYVPCGNAGDAAHAIATCSNELEFMPFAIPMWKNQQILGYPLPRVQAMVHDLHMRFAATFKMSVDDTYEKLCQDAKDLSIEGWVLKDFNYSQWWKVKPQKEIDGVVTGFVDGNGKYLGGVGSLKISVFIDGKFVEIAKVSGMPDDVRWDIDEKKDLGRVCEVEYQEVGNGGRLIHAHFVRWRDDKLPQMCTYERSEL